LLCSKRVRVCLVAKVLIMMVHGTYHGLDKNTTGKLHLGYSEFEPSQGTLRNVQVHDDTQSNFSISITE
jgi:hypothetical protein